MKKLTGFILGCILVTVHNTYGQQKTWREKAETKQFLARLDSVLEANFKHPMEPFDEFEPGALNFIKTSAGLPGGKDEYVYNEAYSHTMSTLHVSFEQIPQTFFLEDAAEQAHDSRTKSFMELLNPDKYWVSYHELNGKYYYVLCLGVDREKTYREMGYGTVRNK